MYISFFIAYCKLNKSATVFDSRAKCIQNPARQAAMIYYSLIQDGEAAQL